LALVTFAYVGYPILIFVLSRLFGRQAVPRTVDDCDLPTVSLLIAAHNEESEIEDRVLNALALDYPRDKLEIVIASDGSTDRTNEIVQQYARHGVTLFAYPERSGKATVLNKSVPRLRGEIALLSDANTHMAPDSARRLATWFADPDVGAVCARLVLTDPQTGQNIDGLYWKYETFLKKCESRLGALLGSSGALYAIRKHLVPLVPAVTLNEDMVIPLEAKRRSGCRVEYDGHAVAWEVTPPTIRAEFRRRVRIGAGGFQSIEILWPLLAPKHGWVTLTFLCHKILRWACPFLLVAALLCNLVLVGDPLYRQLLAAQLGFYALAVVGMWLPAQPRWLRYLRVPTMFASMNVALLFGFFRWLTRLKSGTWKPTERANAQIPGEPRMQPVASGR
jgi:cellulose synthase/poly-beta-1,6-N-acetylglucosamine synthase-like glycosyltransferase